MLVKIAEAADKLMGITLVAAMWFVMGITTFALVFGASCD